MNCGADPRLGTAAPGVSCSVQPKPVELEVGATVAATDGWALSPCASEEPSSSCAVPCKMACCPSLRTPTWPSVGKRRGVSTLASGPAPAAPLTMAEAVAVVAKSSSNTAARLALPRSPLVPPGLSKTTAE
eukprot:scaffold1906_cov403-Prasinococcus_capsulatus_cf.AAC.11